MLHEKTDADTKIIKQFIDFFIINPNDLALPAVPPSEVSSGGQEGTLGIYVNQFKLGNQAFR